MNIRDQLTEIFLLVKKYFELLLEEVKLRQYEVVAGLLAGLFASVLMIIIIVCALIIGIVALCLWFSELWDSYALGFAGGAGVFVLLFIILMAARKPLLETPLKNMFVKIITKK
jgi:hypothetical protein